MSVGEWIGIGLGVVSGAPSAIALFLAVRQIPAIRRLLETTQTAAQAAQEATAGIEELVQRTEAAATAAQNATRGAVQRLAGMQVLVHVMEMQRLEEDMLKWVQVRDRVRTAEALQRWRFLAGQLLGTLVAIGQGTGPLYTRLITATLGAAQAVDRLLSTGGSVAVVTKDVRLAVMEATSQAVQLSGRIANEPEQVPPESQEITNG